MSAHRPLYEHRQTGWAILASSLIPFVALACIWWMAPVETRSMPPKLVPILCGVSALGVTFSWLTVIVTDDFVVFRFGIGLFRRAIALDDIRGVAVVRTRWYEGWGIHWTRRGWLYNVAGFDAVAITRVNGRTLRIGSDDATRLNAAILRAIAARRPRASR
jgi:hypothetical protein